MSALMTGNELMCEALTWACVFASMPLLMLVRHIVQHFRGEQAMSWRSLEYWTCFLTALGSAFLCPIVCHIFIRAEDWQAAKQMG